MVSERRRPKVLTGDSSGLRLFFYFIFLSFCLVTICALIVLWSRGLDFLLGQEVTLLDLSDVIMKRFVGCLLEEGF